MTDEILNVITLRILTQILVYSPETKRHVSIDISPKTRIRIA